MKSRINSDIEFKLCEDFEWIEGTRYKEYGIDAFYNDEKVSIKNISTDKSLVERMLDKIIKNDVSRVTFYDVVYDMLCEEFTF